MNCRSRWFSCWVITREHVRQGGGLVLERGNKANNRNWTFPHHADSICRERCLCSEVALRKNRLMTEVNGSRQMGDSSLQKPDFSRLNKMVRLCLGLALYFSSAYSLIAQLGVLPLQVVESEGVSQLRRALRTNYPSPSERDRAIKHSLSLLRSLADWQAAATLVEWHESATNDEAQSVDQVNHAIVLAYFTKAVRQILHQGQPENAAATLEMLGHMADSAHAAGESLTLLHDFAPDLADMVVQGPPALRGRAAHTLSQIDPPVSIAVPVLSELLRTDDASLRFIAADSFARLLRNVLQTSGESGDVHRPSVRRDLVQVASTVVPAVHAGLNDARPEVRRFCLESIGLACVVLTRLMDQPPKTDDPSLRRSLKAEYEELGPLLLALRDQGPVLEHFLHDSDARTRILTHKALEELGVARSRWLQRCAAEQVGTDEKLIRELLNESVPGLAEELAHPNVQVRRSALDVLEMSGTLALPALPALTRALHDPDRFVRWSAVRTVGKLGPAASQMRGNLNELLSDPDEELRKAAANALEHLQSQTEPRPN